MREDELKRRIIDRMSRIEHHVMARTEQGFADVALSLETLYREILNATHGWNLVSANFPARDFPAIDLHDRSSRIAVQVTVTCDSAKIAKTIDAFTKAGLDSAYDRLLLAAPRIVKSSKKLTPWTELFPRSKLLNLDNLRLDELEVLDDRLSRSIPEEITSSVDDHAAFDLVLDILDRPAIQHRTHVEGNFESFVDALKSINEMAAAGSKDGTPVLGAKPRHDYGDPYRAALSEIVERVGRMKALVERHMEGPTFLPAEAANRVDAERALLVQYVNEFCETNGHATRITAWG